MIDRSTNHLNKILQMGVESPKKYIQYLQKLLEDDTKGSFLLYKYQDFDQGVNELNQKYFEANLRNGTMWFAHVSQFNDPFDSQIAVNFQASFVQQLEDETKIINRMCEALAQGQSDNIATSFSPQETKIIQSIYSDVNNLDTSYYDLTYNVVLCLTRDTDLTPLLHMIVRKIDLSQCVNEMKSGNYIDNNFDFNDFISNFWSLAPSEFMAELDEQTTKVYQYINEQIEKWFAMGCLTVRNDNRSMWAYYAHNHEGFCFEYDMSDFNYLEARELVPHPVAYSNKRPQIPWKKVFQHNANMELEFMSCLLTKDKDWENEQEWRIIKNRQDGQLKQAPKITCIYLGVRIKPDNKALMLTLAQELGIPVKQMVISKDTFDLIAEDAFL